ncbi:hypothetical protein RYX36_009414 [Vicia faba]
MSRPRSHPLLHLILRVKHPSLKNLLYSHLRHHLSSQDPRITMLFSLWKLAFISAYPIIKREHKNCKSNFKETYRPEFVWRVFGLDKDEEAISRY